MQQEHNLERAFNLKKELEAINRQKEQLLDKKKALNHQRDALEEEIELRDVSSAKFLDKVLARGTQIEQRLLANGAIDNQEAAELLKALVDRRLGEEFSKQNLLDKLYEAKVREMKKNETLARDKIKGLNQEKQKLLELETRVLEEKGKFEVLRQRGLDFLIEIEMGNGPDVEEIKKNIEVNPRDYSNLCLRERFLSKEEILTSANTIAQFGGERVNRLKQELIEDRGKLGKDEEQRERMAQYFSKVPAAHARPTESPTRSRATSCGCSSRSLSSRSTRRRRATKRCSDGKRCWKARKTGSTKR